jgi:hypothetical protein
MDLSARHPAGANERQRCATERRLVDAFELGTAAPEEEADDVGIGAWNPRERQDRNQERCR